MGQRLLHRHEILQSQAQLLLQHLCEAHFELALLRLVDIDEVEVLLSLITDLTDSFSRFFRELTSCRLC